jgi:cytochrome oxidase assembly protein ShyY1
MSQAIGSRPGAQEILRIAITPRWLVALAALIAFVIACIFLGQWQWDRTQDILAAERSAAAAPIALQELVNDDGTWSNADIGRTVILDGTFTAQELQLPNREFQGQSGSWIVTRFDLSSGGSIAVMRGLLPDGAQAPQVDATAVQLEGVLHPNEAFYEGANENSIVTVDSAAIADEWGTDLIDGYVMVQRQDPEPSEPGALVIVAPTVQVGDVPFPLQNFFYAIQWWIFAAFAIFVYARWLYLDAKK